MFDASGEQPCKACEARSGHAFLRSMESHIPGAGRGGFVQPSTKPRTDWACNLGEYVKVCLGGGLFDQLDFVIWVRQHLLVPMWRGSMYFRKVFETRKSDKMQHKS